jgi:O-antigen/teichoic acid export membrane protein
VLTRDVLFKPMLQLAAGRTLGFVSTFMIPVVLVRFLDQAEFGTYKQLFLVYATLYGIAPIGMAECLYYFLPMDAARAGRFVANSVLALLATGALCLLLLVVGNHALADGMENPSFAAHATLLGLFVMLTMMSAVTEIVMITRNHHRLSATVYTASDAARALSLVIPAVIWHDVHAVMMGAVVFAVLRAVGTLGYLRYELGAELRPDLPLLKKQLAYALPFAAAVTLEITQGSLHQFVVANQFDTATFALYSVGCLQIPLVDFVATGAGSVLMVKMAERAGPSEHAARLELWYEAVRKLALLLLPLVALLLVAGGELIVFLFTERFRASVPVFLISSVAIAFAALPTDSALRAFGDTGILFKMNVVRLVVVGASIYPLLSSFGLAGAAVSVVLGTVAVKAVALAKLRHLLGVGVLQLLPFRDLATTVVLSGAASLLAWGAKSMFVGSTFVSMTVAGLVFVASYVAGVRALAVSNGSPPAAPAV